MGVQKYRRVQDMPDVPLVTDPDERLARMAALWDGAHLVDVDVDDTPRGVQKFKSIEEADKARNEALIARMRRRRARSTDRSASK